MKYTVKIQNDLSQIRRDPNFGSTIVTVLSKSATLYNATKLFKGWYYLESVRGWAESQDIGVVEIIEPYDPNVNYGEDTSDIPNTSTLYNGDELIDAINQAVLKKISCAKIVYTENNVEVPLYTLIRNVYTSLTNMDTAVTKMNNMQDIPKLTDLDVVGMVARVVSTNGVLGVKWEHAVYNDLIGIPEKDVRYVNQF